jgi:hypothetical protein
MFAPPSIPALERVAEPTLRRLVADLQSGEPLPWDPTHELGGTRPPENLAWRHVVYVGVHPRAAVFERLKTCFKPDRDIDEKTLSGSSALLAFALSEKGTLLKRSPVLSACVWAAMRALDPGPESPGWLDGFASKNSGFAAGLQEEWLPESDDGKVHPRVIDHDALWECRDAATAALGADFEATDIRMESQLVGRRGADTFEHDFLNSLIADDLSRVAGAVGNGRIGPALGEYLRPTGSIDRGRRVDVRLGIDEVRRATAPDRVPLGRWPSASGHPLALGQQLAVNEAVALPAGDDHLFAVNGPPGTGKTTMLRELIAALLTQRAERLAALADPREAFVDFKHEASYRWMAGDFRRAIHRLRPELTGYEMVVTSSNNTAVENVTGEIPAIAAVAPEWRERALDIEELQLLAGLAIAPGSDPADPADRPAWALLSAVLGNSKNRSEFVSRVWWNRDKDADKGSPPSRPFGLRDLLGHWAERRDPVAWAQAVADFGVARRRVEVMRDERLEVVAAIDRLGELEPELQAAREAERSTRDKVIESRPRREALIAELRASKDETGRLVQVRDDHQERLPFILRFFARAAWRRRDEELTAEIEAAESRTRELAADLLPLEAEVAAYEEAREAVGPIEAAVEDCRGILSRYREKPGAVLPDASWAADREERELRAPWTDVEWNEARTELFVAALELHRAFLIGAAKPMRETLDGAMDLLSGTAPPSLGGGAALAAWQALFLVVPVVSTTFASTARLFGRVGADSLGWLLVDEAGQATPQNAVGALWRCRRAVIVGDPLQLEPITTVPLSLEEALRAHYDVAEEWLPSQGSAQLLADRLNRFGTTLPGVDGPVWVGAPLSVHRRCDQPMFGLSNEIAYDGLMIDATDPALGEEFAARYPGLPPSKWIDVSSDSSAGNWVPAEGIEVDRILGYLAEVEFDFSRVIAIGPFRDVARQLGRRAARYRGLRAGTIHTAQGREADIVLLVLGSAPDRDGARRWAASKPNLLNVALSRARRRVYVIGDRDSWTEHRYFDLLGARLPYESR